MSSLAFPFQAQRWPVLLPSLVAAFFTLAATAWAPWERVLPNDPSLHEALGYAPVWSYRFSGMAGAHVDWMAFLVNITIIWVICLTGALTVGITSRPR